MISSLNRSVDDYLKEFQNAIISSIDNLEWSKYRYLVDNLILALGIIVDGSISPNRSGIVRSTFSVLFDIAIKLLQSNEYDRLLDLLERVFSRYQERKMDNEPRDFVSSFFGDLVIWKYSEALYKEIQKGKIFELPDAVQSVTQLRFLVEQHFLFFRLFHIQVFDQSISEYFSCILNNVKLAEQEKEFAITSCIRELYRITQHDLGELRHFSDERDRADVLRFYVLEWSAILRYLYQKDMYSAVEMIFSNNSSNVIGIDLVTNQFFPQLVHVFIMMIVMDRDHEISYKDKYAKVLIPQKYVHSIGISEYILQFRYRDSFENLKGSYISFTKLAERWKTRSNTLTTFDHSPENYIILFSIFHYDPAMYSEFISWAMELTRFDRFEEMLDNVKSSIDAYPNHLVPPTMGLRLQAFITMFPSVKLSMENPEHLIRKVSCFKDISSKMLTTWIMYNQLDPEVDSIPFRALAQYVKSWYYAKSDDKEQALTTLKAAITIDSKFKHIARKEDVFNTYQDDQDFIAFVNPDGFQTEN